MKLNRLLSFFLSGLIACNPNSNDKKVNDLPDKKEEKGSGIYTKSDYSLIINHSKEDNVAVDRIEIGELFLPSGHIVVCDPLANPDMPRLTRSVMPGKYPVTLYMMDTED